MLANRVWRQRVYQELRRNASTRAKTGTTIATQKNPGRPLHGSNVKHRSAEDTAALVARRRRLPFIGMSLIAIGLGTYVVLLYISSTRAPPDSAESGPTTQSQLTEVYDRTAEGFDADVNVSEKMMGITRVRRELAGQCKGHVLEVSCGTARNLGHYRFGAEDGVKSLTLVDLSAEMVEQGKRKWTALRGSGRLTGAHKDIPVRFWKGDVKGSMPPPPVLPAAEEGVQVVPMGYDTIIQSMGLCSTDDPVQLLRSLAGHLNRQNPEARILLLEHGRSYYAWWNGVLDTQAAVHASKHGCWWNRDIGEIVRQSGLEVIRERRRNFGTTWVFELKPAAVATEKSAVVPAAGARLGEESSGIQDQRSWLESWLPRWTYEKICKR